MNATRYVPAQITDELRAALLAYAEVYSATEQDEETVTANLTLALGTEEWSADFGMISQTEGSVEINVADGRYFSIRTSGLIETVEE